MHLVTQSALLRALGWSLFNSLWQMGLLYIFYSVIVTAFRDLTARVRHGLILLLLTAGTVWSLLTFISAYWLAPGEYSGLATSFLPQHGAYSFLTAGRRQEVLPYFSTLYLFFLCGLLIRYFRHYHSSQRLAHNGLSAVSPELSLFADGAARRMGIRPTVRIYLSRSLNVPVTLGFLKPLILLPVSMVTHLTPVQIEAIVVHELAHIRRQDYLVHLLTSVLELLFFFNPFTRLLINQLRKEREHCCDDEVLQFRYDPATYVSALLSLARHNREGRMAVAAIGGGEKLLLQRAKKILHQKRSDDRRGAGFFVLIFLTVGLMAFAILTASGPRSNTFGFLRTSSASAAVHVVPPAVQIRSIGRPVTSREVPAVVVLNGPRINVSLRAVVHHTPSARRGHAATVQQRRNVFPGTNDLAGNHNVFPGSKTFTILTAGPDAGPVVAGLVEIDDRDFSLGTSAVPNDPQTADGQTRVLPYVPSSSFSFQYTDTLAPGEKLALLQQFTEDELYRQLDRLQQELDQHLKVYQDRVADLRKASAERARTGISNIQDVQRLKALLEQQEKLRAQYLKSLNDLQRQFQKAGGRLTIVYI